MDLALETQTDEDDDGLKWAKEYSLTPNPRGLATPRSRVPAGAVEVDAAILDAKGAVLRERVLS